MKNTEKWMTEFLERIDHEIENKGELLGGMMMEAKAELFGVIKSKMGKRGPIAERELLKDPEVVEVIERIEKELEICESIEVKTIDGKRYLGLTGFDRITIDQSEAQAKLKH